MFGAFFVVHFSDANLAARSPYQLFGSAQPFAATPRSIAPDLPCRHCSYGRRRHAQPRCACAAKCSYGTAAAHIAPDLHSAVYVWLLYTSHAAASYSPPCHMPLPPRSLRLPSPWLTHMALYAHLLAYFWRPLARMWRSAALFCAGYSSMGRQLRVMPLAASPRIVRIRAHANTAQP
jgi:hypothetical protein